MKASVLIFVSLISTLLFACSPEEDSPESQIKVALEAMETAVEARSNSDVLEWISQNYSDHYGHDRQHIRKIIALQLLRNQKISVFSLIRSIKVEETQAQVELSVATSGQEVDLSTESNRLKADVYKISLLMALEDQGWRVISASWERGW